MNNVVLHIASAVSGLVIGSFLTVVVDRVPRRASVVAPPSACGTCGHRLGPADLVPVVSWIIGRGRCRHCGEPIGAEPLAIELGTAVIFVVLAARFGANVELIAFWVLGAALVALTSIDLRTQRLPRQISYTAFALGAPLLAAAALINDEPRRILMMLGGAALAGALMALLFVVSRGGLGDGDVRLAPLLGLYLGWLNPGLVLVGLFYGFFIGAVVSLGLMALGRAGRRTAVPFGPFLAAGTITAILTGQTFIDALLVR